jgi:hypothetical protein
MDVAHGPQSEEARFVEAWCEWLDALARDAEAALAAAMAYQELDAGARDRWLSALEQDAKRLKVPLIAIYAPLLAVESDATRRARMAEAMGPADASAQPQNGMHALFGTTRDERRVAAIITPLYLDFVQVLACGYRASVAFDWVRHDPIISSNAVPVAGSCLEGARLESIPLKPLVDELAHTVVAHRRSGLPIPEALTAFADLFGPDSSGSVPPPPP